LPFEGPRVGGAIPPQKQPKPPANPGLAAITDRRSAVGPLPPVGPASILSGLLKRFPVFRGDPVPAIAVRLISGAHANRIRESCKDMHI
jgi:hypothetical protein